VAEHRYQAVLAVISDGQTVTEVAAAVGVSRQTMHAWLAHMGRVDGSESALDDAVPIDLGQRVPVEPPPGTAGGDLVGYRE
jgi:transposase-like protein